MVKPAIGANLSVKAEPADQKMVQIPMTEYLELVKQINEMKELKERVAKLEEHCEKSGYTRTKSVTPY